MIEKDSLDKLKQKVGKQLSFTGNTILKRLNNSLNNNNNEKENQEIKTSLKAKKYILNIKKINIKERKNKYYSDAMKNIFFNPNIYLNNNYKGKKIIIGKKYKKIKGIQELYDFYYRQNKRRKTTASKTKEIKSLNLFQKVLHKAKSLKFGKYQDLSRKNSSDEANRTIFASPVKNEVKDFSVSDNELKMIYKDFVEREERNKKRFLNNLSHKNFLNKTQGFWIGPILNLQEKILEIKNKRSKINQKISNKIMKSTFKTKDKLLMNEQKELLVIKGKTLDKELTKFNFLNQNENEIMKNWIYNLRLSNKEIQNSKLKSPEEFIYSNKNISQEKNEFNIRRQLFKKISINNNKENKSQIIININKKRNYYRNKDITNKSVDLKSVHNLFIQGKNLLNQEIKLSKELIGKKKKLFQYSFVPNEISSILVAKSNSVDDIITPRAVINSMDIHKYP